MRHSLIVLVQCLRVNGLKREWWLDLPELTSIRLGEDAFYFKNDDSTELIMRSDDDEMKWWIDLPKLTSLTTTRTYLSCAFCNPRSITLEGISYHSILTNRHAFSHYCFSWHTMGFQTQENSPHEEFIFLPSLIPRHHSRSPTVSPVHCFFHTPFSYQHQIAVFISHSNYSFHSSISLFLFSHVYHMSCYQAFLHTKSLIS